MDHMHQGSTNHLNEEKIKQLLKTGRGQMSGILKMYEEGRYCVDISKQILSVIVVLYIAMVLNFHLRKSCFSITYDQLIFLNTLKTKL